EPSSILNLLPWQGHTMAPPSILSTEQPWCVHEMLNALNWPSAGCTTTTFRSAKIFPPPTGISEVVASPPSPAPGGGALDAAGALDSGAPAVVSEVVVSEVAVPEDVLSLPPQAARASVRPPAPTPASTALRLLRSSPMRQPNRTQVRKP